MEAKNRNRKHNVLEPNSVNEPSDTVVSHESIIFLQHNMIAGMCKDAPSRNFHIVESLSFHHVLKHFGVGYQPHKDCESTHD